MHTHKPNLTLGAVVCTIGYFFIALMGACSKLLDPQIPVSAILLFQNGIFFLLTLPQTVHHGPSTLKTEKWGLHLVRDAAGVLTFFSLFFALKTIPLIDGVLLQNSAPLWIPLVVLVWLKLKMRGYLWWGMIVGFAGIILVLKPGPEIFSAASCFGVLSGIFLAISLVASRRLTHTEPTYRILFYYALFSDGRFRPFRNRSVENSHYARLDLPHWRRPLYVHRPSAGHLCIQTRESGRFRPIAYTAVVYSGILGWLIWDHIPDLLSCIGLLLVILGCIFPLFREKIPKDN